MARQKGFHEAAVLDGAMRQFWLHGYDGTSIQDLVDATGVNRASLYGTFGDKDRLFRRALDHYLAEVTAERIALLERPGSARAAIRTYFRELVDFACVDGRGLGCLLTNSAVELAPHDERIAGALAEAFARVEAALQATIERGQASGEIPPDKDARKLARFLLALIQGLRVLIRARASRAQLEDAVDVALEALG